MSLEGHVFIYYIRLKNLLQPSLEEISIKIKKKKKKSLTKLPKQIVATCAANRKCEDFAQLDCSLQIIRTSLYRYKGMFGYYIFFFFEIHVWVALLI